MPGFEMHLIAGALGALLMQGYPRAALALLVGSVFPDIDSRSSVTHRLSLISLGVFSMILLYPHGLLASVAATLAITGAFLLLLPKHRNWLHKTKGQLLFSLLCFVLTFDLLVAFSGIIGTTIHRILDGI